MIWTRLSTQSVDGFFVAFLCIFAASVGAASAADGGKNSSGGLVVYSDLNFIQSEGEFIGLQVAIIPYRESDGEPSRQKLLFRSAPGPYLNAPILLDVVKVGAAVKVTVPKRSEYDDFAGVWNFSLKGDILSAIGPSGQRYDLKKISLK